MAAQANSHPLGEHADDSVTKERVLAAMSGGVDSSVAALLLLDDGYDVTGTTLKLFSNEDAGIASASACCSLEDIGDAREVAHTLGIPHYVFNFSRSFASGVMDRFCSGYLRGETPNPCIDCNRFVKFEALQKRRSDLGFDYVATGHYARRVYDAETGRYLLKKGVDPAKDQSYVLYGASQEDLAHLLFPLGGLTKQEVRSIARDAGFVTADKRESQDICFVPQGDYTTFIEGRLAQTGCSNAMAGTFEPGPIVNREGKVLGEHRGVAHYTVGQRKGLGLAFSEPLYVCKKDADTNTLVVGTRSQAQVTKVMADSLNLIAVETMEQPLRVTVKTQYRSHAEDAWAEQTGDDTLEVTFDQPHDACAAGQAVVLYDGDTVVGGGTIRQTR